MRPVLLIVWTAFRSFILRDNNSEEAFLKAVRRKGVENQETAASFKDRRRTENIQGWKEMPLHGQFARLSKDKRNDETVTWLKEGKLKSETESLNVAAQDQAIGTNYKKATIDRTQTDPKCRIRKQNNETISILYVRVQNWHKKNIKRDMTT